MAAYCEHMQNFTSHSSDISIETSKSSKKEVLLEIKSAHNFDKHRKTQFYVYICDCFGDLKDTNKKLRIDVTHHLVSGRLSSYMEQPSFRSLRTLVLPIAFLGYALLVAFVLIVT